MENIYLGLDIGSVSVKIIFLTASGEILEEHYIRHKGLPFETTYENLKRIFSSKKDTYGENGERLSGVALTGTGSAVLAEIIGAVFVNEIVAQSRTIGRYYPDVRTVIEMGGEDSKLLLFEKDQPTGKNMLKDFSMNALCAAGTGSFLDQQASRLNISIEKEFGEYALRSKNPPRIAGRCSVFAKSDMIHLQQVATPDFDIVAGLCFALARNFKATIGKGKEFEKPVIFQGGVAANIGMIRAFTEVLELCEGELIIPKYHNHIGAIGAIFYLIEEKLESKFVGLEKLGEFIRNKKAVKLEKLLPLKGALTKKSTPDSYVYQIPKDIGDNKIDVFIGIDVGSISTNVAVIDRKGRLLAKRYLMTASRPIEAVRNGLQDVGDEIGKYLKVCGVGTTGSGRYLTGDFVGADVICNEITAQATASIFIDPKVDTIFEIGGQDSKYIYIKNGAITEFEMNKACAAGTGSFLEEQAERLSVNIKEEFSALALDTEHPVSLGDRCTVFMESDLVHHQQAGSERKELLAGLAYSTVYNYLNRVVGDKPIGKNIFFQGGTAFNKAVVAAFNRVVGHEITVPPHHEVTGAIGVALIALARHKGESKFKGFDVSHKKYTVDTFECRDCANLCEIRKVEVENEKPLYYGSRCEKYDVDHSKKIKSNLPNLFAERDKMLLEPYRAQKESKKNTIGKVGIPYCLTFYEQLPFWTTFFSELNYEVILSDKTNKNILHSGVESVVTETCFPIKIAHGHILNLLEKKPDIIFLPSIINAPTPENSDKDKDLFNCPYIQTLPYTSAPALNYENYPSTKIFSPIIHLQFGEKFLLKELGKHTKFLKTSKKQIEAALRKAVEAQDRFKRNLVKRGAEIIATLPENQTAIVVVGRPYNTCDSGLNLDLPKKLLKMNVLPIPIDMMPIDDSTLDDMWGKIYWRYGQRILKLANFLNEHPNFHPIYITNFSCGPDSFILKFFGKAIDERPYLQIEIDEHSADAGVITRCEAYLDTLSSNSAKPKKDFTVAQNTGKILIVGNKNGKGIGERTVYLPYMCEHAFAMKGAFNACGVNAEVMPPSNDESLMYGRKYTTGKECYPALLTTGDIIRQIKQPGFDPEKASFFMATANGPCRFGCYYLLQRFILDDFGYKNVPIAILDQDREFDKAIANIDPIFDKLAYWGIITVDCLEKMLYKIRPYEVNAGETDVLFKKAMGELEGVLKQRKHPEEFLKKYRGEFSKIPVKDKGSKPKIGIVGEIYVRMNPFSNSFLAKNIEELGGEVEIATFGEWVDYITVTRSWRNRRLGLWGRFLKDKARFYYQRYFESRMCSIADVIPDASPYEIFDYADKFINPSFHGEAILTIGKAIEYIKHSGVSGIVNTMPFTCMPGTIVNAILKKLSEEYDDIPWITMSYAGQQALNSQARLEAFIYQTKEYKRTRGK